MKRPPNFIFTCLKIIQISLKKSDIKYFLPYILYGYKHKLVSIKTIDIFKLLYRYDGWYIIKNRYLKNTLDG